MWHIRDKQTCCRWLRPNIVWTCNDKCNKHNDHRRIGIISIVDFFFLVCIPDCVRLQCIWYSLLQSYFFLFLSGCDWQFYLLICNLTNCNCVLCAENWAIVICQLRWQQAYVCVCMCEWRSYVPFKCCRRTQPLRVILVIFSISILIHSSQTILSFSDSIATKWLHARTYTFHLLHTFYSSNSNHLMRQRAPGDDWIRETRILRVERCPCGCVFSVLQHNYYATEATT